MASAPRQPPDLPASVRFAHVDLTQPTAAPYLAQLISEHEVDSVVHLAFTSRPPADTSWAHELEVIGTMRLLDACAAAAPRKLVLWSQTLVYGAFPDNPHRLDESTELREQPGNLYANDKIEAEQLVASFQAANPGTLVTVLRTAPLIGRRCGSYFSRYLAGPFPPTLMGHDPLVQLLDEDDAVEALKVALDADFAGAFNIAADGVLPLRTAIALAGRIPLPLPAPLARRALGLARLAQVPSWPSALLPYLRYICIANTLRSSREMGFRARCDIRGALSRFAQLGPDHQR